jgi:uncharacterized short protein YbdD (DUF466 family)
MDLLRTIWKMAAEIAGEADYRRYCDRLRAVHPDRKVPSEREFFLARLEEKYSRPARCC